MTFTPDKWWTEKDYRREYNKGWEKSGDENCASLSTAEENYLRRNNYSMCCDEHHAWLDGWLDRAAGRTKYHLQHCENHGDAEGECGEA